MRTRCTCLAFMMLCLGLPQSGSAIAQIAEAATDELLKSLAHSDVEQRRDAAYELVRRRDDSEEIVKAFATAVSDKDTQVRFQALLGLARSGSRAEPAIPQLLECLNDQDDQIRYRAADALGKIGVASLQPLIEQWPGATENERIAAAQAFGTMAAAAQPAAPLLSDALCGPLERLPRHAAEALVQITPADEAVVLKLVKHPAASVRRVGIAALAAVPNPSEVATRELRQALVDPEPKIRETAIIALAKSPLPASEKETLVEAGLLDAEESVRAAALMAMLKAGLTGEPFALRIAGRLKEAEPPVATTLIRALGISGPGARASLPKIIDMLAAQAPAGAQRVDDDAVAHTLAGLGETVVADLLAAIEARPAIEPTLSLALAGIGEPAVEELRAGMSSEREVIRLAATRAIGGIRPLNEALLKGLVDAASDSSPQVRSVAIDTLIAAGSDAPEVKGTLVAAAQDTAPQVRATAIAAFSKLTFTQEQMQVALDAALSDTAPQVRATALKTLGELPQQLGRCVARVVELCADEEVAVREAALQAITKGGQDLKASEQTPEGESGALASAIVTALKDPEFSVRIAATHAAQQLQLVDGSVLDAIASNLVDDPELLRISLDAISGFGEKADALIPAVSALLSHEKAAVRAAAIVALAAIEKDPQPLAARLTEMLDDSQWEVRRVAGEQLGKLGPQAKAAVPKLFALLRSDEDSDFASSSLREIDAAPVEAIPLLMAALESEERRVGFYAVSLLGKVGPAAAEALPKLEAMLADSGDRGGDSDFRRKFLREAIAAIKGEAKPQ